MARVPAIDAEDTMLAALAHLRSFCRDADLPVPERLVGECIAACETVYVARRRAAFSGQSSAGGERRETRSYTPPRPPLKRDAITLAEKLGLALAKAPGTGAGKRIAAALTFLASESRRLDLLEYASLIEDALAGYRRHVQQSPPDGSPLDDDRGRPSPRRST